MSACGEGKQPRMVPCQAEDGDAAPKQQTDFALEGLL
jgi:hypothetical protein